MAVSSAVSRSWCEVDVALTASPCDLGQSRRDSGVVVVKPGGVEALLPERKTGRPAWCRRRVGLDALPHRRFDRRRQRRDGPRVDQTLGPPIRYSDQVRCDAGSTAERVVVHDGSRPRPTDSSRRDPTPAQSARARADEAVLEPPRRSRESIHASPIGKRSDAMRPCSVESRVQA